MTKEQIKREEEWQAQSDAEMMARYQDLLDDKPRLRRAKRKARELASNLNKQANNMSKVAGK